MRRAYEFRTVFGEVIADHWRASHPEEYERLAKQGLVAKLADECADKAAELFSGALNNGEPAEIAFTFAQVAWKNPPERKPRPYKVIAS